MKKIVFTAVVICFAAFTTSLKAQDDKVTKTEKEKKQTQEIVIRKKGEKDTKIVVEIKGDAITINGKPLSEFKDDEITVNRRNVIIRDGKAGTRYQFTPKDIEGFSWSGDDNGEPRAFLGVTTKSDNDGKEDSKSNGAEITNVTKESAAEKAGLKNGDVITKINDKKVEDPESLADVVISFKPKEEVTVYYKRDGKESSVKATLGECKSSMSYSFGGLLGDMSPRVWSPGSGNNYSFDTHPHHGIHPRQQKLGLKIQDTEDGKGVKVLDVDKDSPAEKAGLKTDDVVTEIGGKKVSNTDEARDALHDNMEKSAYNIKAARNGNAMSFDIKIPKKLKAANL